MKIAPSATSDCAPPHRDPGGPGPQKSRPAPSSPDASYGCVEWFLYDRQAGMRDPDLVASALPVGGS